ncbi:MAG: ABC transporter ATP-binding protein [Syntrophaceae bacterium]|nr:ABC transporter ATP-binding protein [Syntrophaceae bacterium]
MISIRNLYVELGDFTLKDASLDVEDGEYMVVVGPSGAGKTVLLESIAGLYSPRQGEIRLRGRDVTRLSPEERHVSIVYQDHALFPHLSVRDNIFFGLRMRRIAVKRAREAFSRVVELFNIQALLDRDPPTLSGGEQQKVALARALCVSPDVLLLDEPLSSLDPKTREEIEAELHHLHRALDVTTLHVTHNFEEAVALGDRIAVIGEGEVKQVGTPEDIFRKPNSEFVAGFAMSRNILKGELCRTDAGQHGFKAGRLLFHLKNGNAAGNRAVIRPEEVMIMPQEAMPGGTNTFTGDIVRIADRGSTLYVDVSLPPVITALVTRHTLREMKLKTGMRVCVCFDASSVHVFQE